MTKSVNSPLRRNLVEDESVEWKSDAKEPRNESVLCEPYMKDSRHGPHHEAKPEVKYM
jgi:hypothetical protein